MRVKNSITTGALIVALALGISLQSCSENNKNGPQIADLVYELMQVPVDQGRTATVTGMFNIVRRSEESASVNTLVYDSAGKQVGVAAIPLTDKSLRSDDTLAFGVAIDTSKKEAYTFEVYITDAKGKQSNRLIGSVKVTDLF